jgi:hypothetical protein
MGPPDMKVTLSNEHILVIIYFPTVRRVSVVCVCANFPLLKLTSGAAATASSRFT